MNGMHSEEQAQLCIEVAPANIMVIFGAGGDLTRRMLMPALYRLLRDGYVNPDVFSVVCIDREDHTDASFRDRIDTGSRALIDGDLNEPSWQRLLECVHYLSGDFSDTGLYTQLDSKLQDLVSSRSMPANYLFYFATPPRFFAEIATRLGSAGLLNEVNDSWRRVIIEKPFGHDLTSARDLNRLLHQVMQEQQIYRIDHYLGKETVQNILAYRFANSIVEPIWNRQYIDHVQITVSESLGIGARGRYYEQAGALRDMVPNHLLAVLSVIAMEPPNSFAAEDVRNEQTKVLRAIQPLTTDEILTCTVRGQYGSGVLADGSCVHGYRDEAEVAAESNTETYAAMRLLIDSWRWAGVPFYLRTGKRLPGRYTEVVIQYRHAPNIMFRNSLLLREHVSPNTLVLRLQPDEGIGMNFNAKIPGHTTHLGEVAMNFRYIDHFDRMPASGYETLIHDCMSGDATLFKRSDNIETCWELVEPVLDIWAALPARDFPNYRAGSWGPDSAALLLARDGRAWYPCRQCKMKPQE